MRIEVAPGVAVGHHVELLSNRWPDGHRPWSLEVLKQRRYLGQSLGTSARWRGGNEHRELRDMVKEGGGRQERVASLKQSGVCFKKDRTQCEGISQGANTGEAVPIWSSSCRDRHKRRARGAAGQVQELDTQRRGPALACLGNRK